eukprot:scaffold120414_cov51-Phaeocystis_antarctica.AAC.2
MTHPPMLRQGRRSVACAPHCGPRRAPPRRRASRRPSRRGPTRARPPCGRTLLGQRTLTLTLTRTPTPTLIPTLTLTLTPTLTLTLTRCVAACLHLGNVAFAPGPPSGGKAVALLPESSRASLQAAAALWQVDEAAP